MSFMVLPKYFHKPVIHCSESPEYLIFMSCIVTGVDLTF